MKKELDYFRVGTAYGGSQSWFGDRMMRMGGCAAAAACDSSIYLALYRKARELYPYEQDKLTREDYCKFAMRMKPYLRPRLSGIDTLELYQEGYSGYLSDCGCQRFRMELCHGSQPAELAEGMLRQQIEKGFPVPCLLLHHRNREFKNYDWHWFMLTGYERQEDVCMVKAVTYGGFCWLDFHELWNTGYRKRGGLILYREEQ